MTSDTYAVCQQIAEEIVKGSRHLTVPIFRGANHPIDRGYLIGDTAQILRNHTALPKLVEALIKIREADDNAHYVEQGDRGVIASLVDELFAELQADKPTTGKVKE